MIDKLIQRPLRLSLDELVQRVTSDLMFVFAGNGYPRVAFALTVQDLETDDVTVGGNLKMAGFKALLESVREHIEEEEKERQIAPPQ
jgi:hypothetical protein